MRWIARIFFSTGFLVAMILLLVACGGGGGSASSPSGPAQTLVLGTVAQGVAVVGAAITLKDSAGVSMTATTATDGTYTLDASGLTAPIVVVAVGVSSAGVGQTTLVSCKDVITAHVTNYVNVTPWTTAICAMLSSTGKAGDLDPIKDKDRIVSSLTLVDSYTTALLAPTLSSAGFLSTQGPITTPFTAKGRGYDSIYDNLIVGVTPSNAVFMADKNLPACLTGQLSGCVLFSDSGSQTAMNPNNCGSDIGTGVPIPCDSALPLTATPPVNNIITGNNPYAFGCNGCIFWGPLDNFSGVSSQTPLSLIRIVPADPRGSG